MQQYIQCGLHEKTITYIRGGESLKIDLHCHTKKIKKGDPITRNVTPEIFAKKYKMRM